MPVNKSLLRDLYYLCIWIEATLSKTYEKRRSVMLHLVVVNVGNSLRTKISIVVLTHTRGSLLLHLSKRFPTTYNQDVA